MSVDIVKVASATLGYGIVFGSAILKVPQILTIVRSKSADGVSLASHLMETFGYSVSLSWGIAQGLKFSDFGENAFVFAQLMVLNVLIGFHTKLVAQTIIACALLALLGWLLSMRMLPLRLHEILFSSQILFTIASRVPQIYLNYRRRSIGQLSFTTCFLAFGGTSARLLTTFVSVDWEKGKAMMLTQFFIATTLNGLIVLQFFFYSRSSFRPTRTQDNIKTKTAPTVEEAPRRRPARKE